MDVVPQPTRDTQPDRFVVDIRTQLQRDHDRLPDPEAQRQLLERLRAKYTRMGGVIGSIGHVYRAGRWSWYLAWASYLVFVSRYCGGW